jgi:predicted thioesterase
MARCCQVGEPGVNADGTLAPAAVEGDRMKPSLQPGVSGTATYTVTAEMSPPHLPVKVLSTPSMIQLIEATCLQTAQEHLDDEETTVGTHVCVSHKAAAMEGEQVEVTCELTEVDRRRLEFATRVTAGDRVLSEGTHQRFVVSASTFG